MSQSFDSLTQTEINAALAFARDLSNSRATNEVTFVSSLSAFIANPTVLFTVTLPLKPPRNVTKFTLTRYGIDIRSRLTTGSRTLTIASPALRGVTGVTTNTASGTSSIIGAETALSQSNATYLLTSNPSVQLLTIGRNGASPNEVSVSDGVATWFTANITIDTALTGSDFISFQLFCRGIYS